MNAAFRLRVSVMALFVDGDEVLLLHQTTPPEPDRWDLPGGGLKPDESLMDGLRREVFEEVGLINFTVEGILAVIEGFFPDVSRGQGTLHTLSLVYRCAIAPKPLHFHSDDPEVGPKGIRWLPVAQLHPGECTTRTWQALQAAGLVSGDRQLP